MAIENVLGVSTDEFDGGEKEHTYERPTTGD